MDSLPSFLPTSAPSPEIRRKRGIISIIAIILCLVSVGSADMSASDWNNLGESYYESGEYETAISAFLNAVSIESDYAEAWNNLGLAYLSDRQYSGALSAFKQAVSLDSSYYEAWNNLGDTYELLDRSDDAGLAYQRAAALSNDDGSVSYSRPPFTGVQQQPLMGMYKGNPVNQPQVSPVPPLNQGSYPRTLTPGIGPRNGAQTGTPKGGQMGLQIGAPIPGQDPGQGVGQNPGGTPQTMPVLPGSGVFSGQDP